MTRIYVFLWPLGIRGNPGVSGDELTRPGEECRREYVSATMLIPFKAMAPVAMAPVAMAPVAMAASDLREIFGRQAAVAALRACRRLVPFGRALEDFVGGICPQSICHFSWSSCLPMNGRIHIR